MPGILSVELSGVEKGAESGTRTRKIRVLTPQRLPFHHLRKSYPGFAPRSEPSWRLMPVLHQVPPKMGRRGETIPFIAGLSTDYPRVANRVSRLSTTVVHHLRRIQHDCLFLDVAYHPYRTATRSISPRLPCGQRDALTSPRHL
jgi:hypothetical protein